MTTRVIVPGETRAAPDLLGRRFVCFGHSYMAADAQSTPGYRYVQQVATRIQSVRFDNYAVGGRSMRAVYDIAVLAWNHDPEAIVCIDAMLNTMRMEGTFPGSIPTLGVNPDATGMEMFRKDFSRILDLVRDAYAVLCVEQPYLPQADYDYFSGDPFFVPMSDAVIDTYNAVLAAEAAKRRNVYVVPVNRLGVIPELMTLERHNTDAGMRNTAWRIDDTMSAVVGQAPLPDPIPSPLALPLLAAYWPGDPDFVPPADGAVMAQLDDATGHGWHATQPVVGNRGTFDASNPNFNGVPTFHLNGAFSQFYTTPNWGTYYQPTTILAIVKTDTGSTMNLLDGLHPNRRHLIRKVGITNRRIATNVNLNDAVPDNNAPVLITACFGGDDAWLEINGVRTAAGDINNTTILHVLQGLTIGRSADGVSPMTGDFAFIGVLPGEINLMEKYLFEKWAVATCGLPIVPEVPPVIDPVPPPDIPGDLVGLPWHTVLYAGGDWAHPADEEPLPLWPDSSGDAHDAVQSDPETRGVYQVAGLYGRQCVRFDGSDFMITDLFEAVPQPYTFVFVGVNEDVGTGAFMDGGTGSQRALLEQVGGVPGTGYYRLYAGNILDSAPGTADYVPHLFVAVYNGNQSYLERDGERIMTGNAGTDAIQGLTIGGGYLGIGEAFLTGAAGLAGFLPMAITPGDNDIIKNWVTNEYGIPMVG